MVKNSITAAVAKVATVAAPSKAVAQAAMIAATIGVVLATGVAESAVAESTAAVVTLVELLKWNLDVMS